MSRPTTPVTTSAPPQPSPLRSTTAPIKKHHHHHIPHHPHRHHHHRDKSVPQSAIVPSSTSNAFDSLLAPLTKATSRTEGVPDLTALLKEEREAKARERAEAKEREDARRKGWDEVRRLREGRRIGESHLTSTLQSLSTLSATTTRRLDYTYYSLLSSLSSISSTLSSLLSLSHASTSLLRSFETQSTALDRDITFQIYTLAHNTDTQASRITQLEQRMRDGKQRVEVLGQRMERVREAVREQERREEEWVERVRRRVRWCWGCAGLMLAVCVVLLVLKHWPVVEKEAEKGQKVVGRFANRTAEEGVGVFLGVPGPSSGSVHEENRDSDEARAKKDGVRDCDDPVLRMLDEL